jgi:hypothetical protein
MLEAFSLIIYSHRKIKEMRDRHPKEAYTSLPAASIPNI